MAIKISKVIADLNVGRQTIEEFLHKKGIEISANINARIDDDIYEMLVKEFKPDMDLKNKSDKMANERQKEKAKQNAVKESHEIKTVLPGQKPKILGKIDLEAAGKPKPAAKPADEPEAKEEITVKEDRYVQRDYIRLLRAEWIFFVRSRKAGSGPHRGAQHPVGLPGRHDYARRLLQHPHVS